MIILHNGLRLQGNLCLVTPPVAWRCWMCNTWKKADTPGYRIEVIPGGKAICRHCIEQRGDLSKRDKLVLMYS